MLETMSSKQDCSASVLVGFRAPYREDAIKLMIMVDCSRFGIACAGQQIAASRVHSKTHPFS